MPDPIILAAREILEESLGHLRASIAGLTTDALAWRPPGEETNPITVLATHSMHSTRWWLTIARGAPLPDRDRPSEFLAESASDTELLSLFDRMAAECRALLETEEVFEPGVVRLVPDDEPVTAAWALLHAIEHLREHVAQAQLTRQLWQERA